MAHPAGESNGGALRLDFDRRIMLQFCGSVVTSDAGLLPYRELDDVLGLTVIAGNSLADARTGKNGRHALVGLLRQSVFSRLAGYEDVRPVPPGANDLSQSLRVVLVRLVDLHLEGGARMPGIETNDFEPEIAKFMHEPWCHRSGLDPIRALSPACRRTKTVICSGTVGH
jgi:hypothetical protein